MAVVMNAEKIKVKRPERRQKKGKSRIIQPWANTDIFQYAKVFISNTGDRGPRVRER